MRINPLNVLNLLLTYYQTLHIPKSETNYEEIQLSEKIKSILIDSTNEFNDIDMIVEDTLDFQEEYKDHNAKIIEDEVQHHIPDFVETPTDHCKKDNEYINFDYKKTRVKKKVWGKSCRSLA